MLHTVNVVKMCSIGHETNLLIILNKLYITMTATAHEFVTEIILAEQIGPITNLLLTKKI